MCVGMPALRANARIVDASVAAEFVRDVTRLLSHDNCTRLNFGGHRIRGDALAVAPRDDRGDLLGRECRVCADFPPQLRANARKPGSSALGRPLNEGLDRPRGIPSNALGLSPASDCQKPVSPTKRRRVRYAASFAHLPQGSCRRSWPRPAPPICPSCAYATAVFSSAR